MNISYWLKCVEDWNVDVKHYCKFKIDIHKWKLSATVTYTRQHYLLLSLWIEALLSTNNRTFRSNKTARPSETNLKLKSHKTSVCPWQLCLPINPTVSLCCARGQKNTMPVELAISIHQFQWMLLVNNFFKLLHFCWISEWRYLLPRVSNCGYILPYSWAVIRSTRRLCTAEKTGNIRRRWSDFSSCCSLLFCWLRHARWVRNVIRII